MVADVSLVVDISMLAKVYLVSEVYGIPGVVAVFKELCCKKPRYGE